MAEPARFSWSSQDRQPEWACPTRISCAAAIHWVRRARMEAWNVHRPQAPSPLTETRSWKEFEEVIEDHGAYHAALRDFLRTFEATKCNRTAEKAGQANFKLFDLRDFQEAREAVG